MAKQMDDSALQDLIKGIAQNASKKSAPRAKKRKKLNSDSGSAVPKEKTAEQKPQAKKVLKKKEAKKYIVVFQDEEGKVLKTGFVEHGKDAEPPVLPEVKEELEHHRVVFAGWDHSGKNVTSNLVIKPVYETVAKQYLIMYQSEDGKILGTEKVSYGQSAVNDYDMRKRSTAEFDYTFVGWSKDLSFVEGDMMVKPIFAPIKRKYVITFRGAGNRIIDSQTVRYGDYPKPPFSVSKPEDEVYYYRFSGWNRDVEVVVGETEYRAVFESIYKEYQFRAYLEDEIILEELYHYGDSINYPTPEKKGYNLIWDKDIHSITEDLAIHGHWDFANKKGHLVQNELGEFRILNPSIHGGCVSLVSCHMDKSQIVIPEKTRLGDYYYKIVRIEKNAFASCKKIKQITLGNQVEEIDERGMGNCPGLKKIIMGKNIKVLGKQLFYGSRGLSEIRIKGSKLKKVSPHAFDQMNGKVKIKADNILPFQLKKIFAKGITSGNVVLL